MLQVLSWLGEKMQKSAEALEILKKTLHQIAPLVDADNSIDPVSTLYRTLNRAAVDLAQSVIYQPLGCADAER